MKTTPKVVHVAAPRSDQVSSVEHENPAWNAGFMKVHTAGRNSDDIVNAATSPLRGFAGEGRPGLVDRLFRSHDLLEAGGVVNVGERLALLGTAPNVDGNLNAVVDLATRGVESAAAFEQNLSVDERTYFIEKFPNREPPATLKGLSSTFTVLKADQLASAPATLRAPLESLLAAVEAQYGAPATGFSLKTVSSHGQTLGHAISLGGQTPGGQSFNVSAVLDKSGDFIGRVAGCFFDISGG